jgi:membrane protein
MLATNWYLAVLGFLFLLFVATTLFSVIKNTINDIWDIQLREKTGFIYKMKMRVRSLAVIVIAGILFLLGILLDSVEVLGSNFIDSIWQGGGRFFKSGMNQVVGVVIVTSWFIILFRYLADARPTWKVSLVGGLLTGILFSIGKVVLAYLMSTSNIGTIYGASGSIVLVLLFVFYSSFILYFGASFIKVYAEELHQPLRPISHAFRYQLKRVV